MKLVKKLVTGSCTIGGFRGKGEQGAMSPRRQKSPFALLNYSFAAANDASLYPLSIQY